MAARSTGWAMLGAASVQETMDFALISQAAALRAGLPFVHFFDGFRTSHEVAKIQLVPDDVMRALMDDGEIAEWRARAMTPDHPVLRGTAQNPDAFFQGREAANPVYDICPDIVQQVMDEFAKHTGRPTSFSITRVRPTRSASWSSWALARRWRRRRSNT